MKKTKIDSMAMIGGGLFVLMVIMKVVNVIFNTFSYIIQSFGKYYFWEYFLSSTGVTLHQVALSVCLLAAGITVIASCYVKKFPLSLVGFGLLTVHALVDLLRALGSLINVFKYFTIGRLFSWFGSNILALLALIGFIAATAIIAASAYVKYEEKRAKIMKLWFVPALLFIPEVLVGIFKTLKGLVTAIAYIFDGHTQYVLRSFTNPLKALIMTLILVVAILASMMFVTEKKFKKKAK